LAQLNPYTPPLTSPEPGDFLKSPFPSRTRFMVLGVLCLLSAILYLDRICIAAAVGDIQTDLGLTNKQVSYVLMAFTLAYGLFELPTGRWGDQLGARRVLTRVSLWWSAFTALTGACWDVWSMVIARFLFGAGEAGAFPNAARILSRWFPDHERGRAQGILVAASQIGGAVAPLLAALLIQSIGWRWTFVAFGSLGCFWAIGFYRWFRDDPAEHPSVNAAEVKHIGRGAASGKVHGAIPWRLVVINPSVWMLSSLMILGSFNSYIYLSWYPKYLNSARNVDLTRAGMMASLVLALAALGSFIGGQLVDRAVWEHGIARRRLMGGSAFFTATLMLGCALLSQNAWLAAGFTALSCFATQSALPLWWSSTTSISGRHVGALFGLMNSMGVFGAMTSQYLVGAIADYLGQQGLTGRAQWDGIFFINLGVLMAAGVFWSTMVYVPVEPPNCKPNEDV
jgi:MFS family permease